MSVVVTAGPAACLGCGSTRIDVQRGWVRPENGLDKVTYFLCNDCLARKPTIVWDGDFPVSITYPLWSRPSRPTLTTSGGSG